MELPHNNQTPAVSVSRTRSLQRAFIVVMLLIVSLFLVFTNTSSAETIAPASPTPEVLATPEPLSEDTTVNEQQNDTAVETPAVAQSATQLIPADDAKTPSSVAKLETSAGETTYYATLPEAFAAVTPGCTVTLLKDVTVSENLTFKNADPTESVPVPDTVTFKTGGKNLGVANGYEVTLGKYADFVIESSSRMSLGENVVFTVKEDANNDHQGTLYIEEGGTLGLDKACQLTCNGRAYVRGAISIAAENQRWGNGAPRQVIGKRIQFYETGALKQGGDTYIGTGGVYVVNGASYIYYSCDPNAGTSAFYIPSGMTLTRNCPAADTMLYKGDDFNVDGTFALHATTTSTVTSDATVFIDGGTLDVGAGCTLVGADANSAIKFGSSGKIVADGTAAGMVAGRVEGRSYSWLPSANSWKAGDVARVNSTGAAYDNLPDAIAAAQPGDTVTLLADTIISETIAIDRNLTLTSDNSSPHTVFTPSATQFNGDNMFVVSQNAGATFTLENVYLETGDESLSRHYFPRGIKVQDGGNSLVMGNDSRIKACKTMNPSDADGGAIVAYGDANVTIDGGATGGWDNDVIWYNRAYGGTVSSSVSAKAGGICMLGTGTLTMESGNIHGNIATSTVGGVYIGPAAKMTWNGGSIYTNATCNEVPAGGWKSDIWLAADASSSATLSINCQLPARSWENPYIYADSNDYSPATIVIATGATWNELTSSTYYWDKTTSSWIPNVTPTPSPTPDPSVSPTPTPSPSVTVSSTDTSSTNTTLRKTLPDTGDSIIGHLLVGFQALHHVDVS